MNKFILYNHYHNGDLFFSRMLLHTLIENGYSIDYFHNLNRGVFIDVPNISKSILIKNK
jgi:hypothetical protein